MEKAYVFYNPLAGEGKILEDLELFPFIINEDCVFCDMTKPETYEESLFAMDAEDPLILCGGDGTLNRFVNIMEGIHRPNCVFYYPAGENNDFARDFGREYGCNPFPVKKALKGLPRVSIGGRSGFFLTGILFDTIRRDFPGNTANIEKDKPCNLKITADKALYHYEKVRFAAVMKGRYCGGGLLPDPYRQRTHRQLSCVVICGCGAGRAKALLQKLQKGTIPHSRHLHIHTGVRIGLSFGRPVSISTDGEIMTGVTQICATEGVSN